MHRVKEKKLPNLSSFGLNQIAQLTMDVVKIILFWIFQKHLQ